MKKSDPVTNNDILEFLKQADFLNKSNFLQNPPKQKAKFKHTIDIKLEQELDFPPREDIEIVLIRIRPFIEYNERLHVGKIITYLLSRYGDSEFLRNYQILFQPKIEQSNPIAMMVNGKG
jgi:hypothetical protein